MGFILNDVPIKKDQLASWQAALKEGSVFDFMDRKGRKHRAIVRAVEWRIPAQGIGAGYFADLTMLDDGSLKDVLIDMQAKT